jgi:hypothetical protein
VYFPIAVCVLCSSLVGFTLLGQTSKIHAMNGIAESARVASHKHYSGEYSEVAGIQCVRGCGAQYRIYIPASVPNGKIEVCRLAARIALRGEHPNHKPGFMFTIPN